MKNEIAKNKFLAILFFGNEVAAVLSSLILWHPFFFGQNKAEVLNYLPENFAVEPFGNFSSRFYEDARKKVHDAINQIESL